MVSVVSGGGGYLLGIYVLLVRGCIFKRGVVFEVLVVASDWDD